MKNAPRSLAICLLCAIASMACQRKSAPVADAIGSTAPPAPVADAPPSSPQSAAPYLMAKLKKTGCYGSCPVFEAQIFSDGTAIYVGEKSCPRIGKFTARTRATVHFDLIKRADAASFFGLENRYPTNGRAIADFPTTTIFLKAGNRTRTVEDNCDAPLNLLEFERYFSALLETFDWQPVQ